MEDRIYCFPQHFLDIKQIIFLQSHYKMPLVLYFRLVTKQVKSVETEKFLQMSHFLLRSSIEHLLRLVVLGNNGDDKISLKL